MLQEEPGLRSVVERQPTQGVRAYIQGTFKQWGPASTPDKPVEITASGSWLRQESVK